MVEEANSRQSTRLKRKNKTTFLPGGETISSFPRPVFKPPAFLCSFRGCTSWPAPIADETWRASGLFERIDGLVLTAVRDFSH